MQWHRLAFMPSFLWRGIYNQGFLWGIPQIKVIKPPQDEHKLRLMKLDKEAQWWMKPLCTKGKNSHPKREAFLNWQNECASLLSSATLNTCRLNSEAASAPPSPPWGWGQCPTPWGATAHHCGCVLRAEDFARKELHRLMNLLLENKINHCNEGMVVGFEKEDTAFQNNKNQDRMGGGGLETGTYTW